MVEIEVFPHTRSKDGKNCNYIDSNDATNGVFWAPDNYLYDVQFAYLWCCGHVVDHFTGFSVMYEACVKEAGEVKLLWFRRIVLVLVHIKHNALFLINLKHHVIAKVWFIWQTAKACEDCSTSAKSIHTRTNEELPGYITPGSFYI